jgi:hypothetical protein
MRQIMEQGEEANEVKESEKFEEGTLDPGHPRSPKSFCIST